MGLRHSYTRGVLFHYTSKETAIEYIFKNMTIKLAALTGTNDLRETEPWYFGASVEDEELSPSSDEFMSANKELDRILKGGCKLACFSEDRPDNHPELDPDRFHRSDLEPQGYAHDRMWAQYAGNHSGVCIFFDRDKLVARMQEHFKGRPGHLLHGSVRYADSVSDGGDPFHVSWDELSRMGVAEYARVHRGRFAQQIYLTKNPDWNSEQEYRFVWIEDGAGREQPEFVPIDGCVSAICLGGRFPQVYEVNLKDIKKRLGIDAHRIHYMRGLQILPALSDPRPPPVPLSPTLQRDETFGSNGVISVFVGDQSRGTAVLLQDDGSAVVGGASSVKRPNGTLRSETFVLTRFSRDGKLDMRFGSGGIVSGSSGQFGGNVRALAIQDDGKILALSTSRVGRVSHAVISRFAPDGSPDVAWGSNGAVVVSVDEGFEGYALAVTAGRIVVVGTCWRRNRAGEMTYPVAILCYEPGLFTKDGRTLAS